ncbi:MAG TPA: hypothetical protein EYP60_09145 [bacterium (Candidatus Stahlbacteria)]|nr:hypothetical protein [Candidatus Stahlbacteria bacterium]
MKIFSYIFAIVLTVMGYSQTALGKKAVWVRTFYTYGMRIGYMFPINNSYGNPAEPLATFDGFGWYETSNFIIEVLVGTSAKDSYSDWHTDFSFLRPIFGTIFVPYIGVGLGLHMVAAPGESDDGLAFNINGGFIGLRTYDVRLILNIKYSIVYASLANRSPQYGFTITFGITHTPRGLWF